jgi:hypothetical protein
MEDPGALHLTMFLKHPEDILFIKAKAIMWPIIGNLEVAKLEFEDQRQ